MSVAWVGAGVAAAGVLSQASSARSAKNAQQQAAADSNALQQYMFDRNVELQQPAIDAGNLARNSLLYRLGLSSTPMNGSNGQKFYTEAELREQLTPQFTTYTGSNGQALGSPTANVDTSVNYANPMATLAALGEAGAYQYATKKFANDPGTLNAYLTALNLTGQRSGRQQLSGAEGDFGIINGNGAILPGQGISGSLDTAGLDAEVAKRLAAQEQARKDYEAQVAGAGGSFGDLAQKFAFNTYTPEKFSYTGEDLYKDPSYQFRLEQGQKALDRAGAAAGRFLSGRQLQATSDYNQGAASQEFQNAYNRALGTFSTNEGNRKNAFDTNETNRFNAYQANFTNAINPLLSLSGSGQVASQFLGNAGQNTANQQSNNLQGAANASGAASIATGNAIANGLNSAYGGYQQNQLLNSLLNRNTGVNNNPSVLAAANSSGDPIYSLGSANGNWWSSK